MGAGPSCQLYGTQADRTGSALYQHHAARDRACDMHATMGGDAGDAEAGPLLEGHAIGERHGLPRRDDDVFGGGAEGSIALGPVAPHPLPDSRRGHAVPHPVDGPGPVAVGDHAGVWHPVAEGVLSLLHVAGVDAGGGDNDADLVRAGLGIRHLAYHQDITRRSLLLIPRCFHRCPPNAVRHNLRDAGSMPGGHSPMECIRQRTNQSASPIAWPPTGGQPYKDDSLQSRAVHRSDRRAAIHN